MAVLMFAGNHIFLQYLGDDGVGAFGVAWYYMPVVFMIGNAIAQSAQPIISYNYGLGQPGRFAGIGNEITGEGRGVYVFKKQPQHFGQLVVDG